MFQFLNVIDMNTDLINFKTEIMKKLLLIFIGLALTFSVFSQSQKELLSTFTKKGNSYLGVELSTNTSGVIGSGFNILGARLSPAVKYQYNVTNRFSIGAGLSTEIRSVNQRIDGEDVNTKALRVGASVLLQYYPFRKNGFYIETEFRNESNLLKDGIDKNFRLGFHPGYTFIVGKNKNIGLDIKMNMFDVNRGLHNFPGRPTVGVKIPLGNSRKQIQETDSK